MTTMSVLAGTIGYLEADPILEAASYLLSEDGENPEYDRGIRDLTTDLLQISTAYYEMVAKELRRRADVRLGKDFS